MNRGSFGQERASAVERVGSTVDVACLNAGDFIITLEGHNLESRLAWARWSSITEEFGDTCFSNGLPSKVDHVLANRRGPAP